jgi:hypothetical protein
MQWKDSNLKKDEKKKIVEQAVCKTDNRTLVAFFPRQVVA